MLAILKKEINSFFASPIGYLVIAIFLLLNGLFLWLFKGEFNILDNGFADLSSFFLLAPWILIFLIPAVTMRSFSDEKKQGTLELLLTKPISNINIVLGKYFGAFVLILIALLPTLLYVYTVYQLGNPLGNIDVGSTLGSYFGLLFLVAAYIAIGVFTSSITDNQIVAFITSVFLCFVFYIGFQGVADFMSSNFVEQLGMSAHYKSMSRGVLDTRDIVYFLSVTVLFIFFTVRKIQTKTFIKRNYILFLLFPLGLFIFNALTAKSGLYQRLDLTQDKRYTISDAALQIVNKVESPILVDVFLEGEDFPTEFRRLQSETKQLLEEFEAENENIKFNFINPIEDEATRERNMQQLNDRGLIPMQLTVQESGKSSQAVIFPWALASHDGVTVKIPLVKNKIGATQQELVTNSVQHLEYAFADGFSKLINPKKRKVAILKGNNQLEDKYIFDFVKTIGDYYFIAPFTLDSVASNAQKTVKALSEFDLLISVKPTEAFSEKEKYVLDQFTMKGGKSLWLVDAVATEKDSLYNPTGKSVAIARDLNLTDFFFKYGVRINPYLVNDLYSAPITLAIGEGSQSQFQQLPWYYSPLVNAENKHAITNNLNLIKFDFANQIDTLKNNVSKTILLKSSVLTKLDGTPREVSLEMTQKEPNPNEYNKGNQNLAVLLEGEFTSVYNNRIKPFSLEKELNKSIPTKMIVIADGDVIKNDVGRNGPQELGFDKWSGQTYGNKEFLLNAVNYLLDDNGLINIRTKEIAVAFLDPNKVALEKTKWQLTNILLPLVLLGVFGFIFNFLRRKKYAK
ncbi:gliding motility-associated ABC transporter substrate-binding protein GldG [Lacinutrix sp. C3R15]|uniref:gliding motility-associated ABC transporter substrate-binding protein GldG n=1 Tax=Flavobacteriaceae TaxID=49546 RepID=UPI001C09DCC7|nr:MULTISPECIES: gliding motility-associated ABC transporter substrate-binding protein GldG [Flavobacteriaceae]MBU2940414.1 gliding motility-associated ABC transporter substrate-binding protein GldG [Lacinutrix sp. C3R15]MDO6623734.1 gliding motility-associated ABC transporter substrate-binding protein GldG [Oceanihabitans sp. 1_MG-2023]